MSKTINLGKSLKDLVSIRPSTPEDTHYPDLYLDADPVLGDLPDKGDATIKYRVISRCHREEKDPDGKKERSCSVRLEILSITVPDKPPKQKSYGEDARKSFRAFYNGK